MNKRDLYARIYMHLHTRTLARYTGYTSVREMHTEARKGTPAYGSLEAYIMGACGICTQYSRCMDIVVDVRSIVYVRNIVDVRTKYSRCTHEV